MNDLSVFTSVRPIKATVLMEPKAFKENYPYV